MTAASDDQIVEALADHWEVDVEDGAWSCVGCGDSIELGEGYGDAEAGLRIHIAEVIEPTIKAREAQVLTTITEAIGGLRDVLVSTSGDQGSYLVAAMLDKAIDIAVATVEPTP